MPWIERWDDSPCQHDAGGLPLSEPYAWAVGQGHLDRQAFHAHGDSSRQLVDVGFHHGDVAANVGVPSGQLAHQPSNLDKGAVGPGGPGTAQDALADGAAIRKAEFGVDPDS